MVANREVSTQVSTGTAPSDRNLIKITNVGVFVGKNKKRAVRRVFTCLLAEKAGFEPAVGYKPTHAFQPGNFKP